MFSPFILLKISSIILVQVQAQSLVCRQKILLALQVWFNVWLVQDLDSYKLIPILDSLQYVIHI